jgi:hypothetical protein
VAWARMDDKMHGDPKILRAGNAATGLFVRSISYACDQLTDGFVPEAWSKANGKPAEIKALVETGLWKKVDGGYAIVKFLDYNRTRAQIKAERQRKSEGGKKGAGVTNQSRWGSGYPEGDAEVGGDGASVAPSPSPVPRPQEGRVQASSNGSNGVGDLPFEKGIYVERLLKGIGDHADAGTEGVLCSMAAQVSEGILAKVHESLLSAIRREGNVELENRAGYVVGALKSELEQRRAAF